MSKALKLPKFSGKLSLKGSAAGHNRGGGGGGGGGGFPGAVGCGVFGAGSRFGVGERLIAVFRDFFVSAGRAFILVGVGTGLSLYGVLTLS